MIQPTPNLPDLRTTESRRPTQAVSRSNRRTSLYRRIAGFLLLMVLFVVAPSGIGLWYSAVASDAVQSMREAAGQSAQVSELQLSWLSVVGTLESLSVTRPTAEIQLQLDSKLADLERKLDELNNTDLGLAPETIAANRQITGDLTRLGDEMRVLSADVYDLTVRNRWSTAMIRRQSGLGELQGQLDTSLKQLNQNVQSDLARRNAEVERLRWLVGAYSIGLMALAAVFGIILLFLARRHVITPMQQLTSVVQRITGKQQAGDRPDFSPVEPLPRNDEIGDLSKAIALMTDWLRESYELLEQRVNERTREVERRRTEIQVAAQVARDIAAARNLESLLNMAVELIRERFGFYHAGIFLTDVHSEYAVLRAATGEAGRQLLARNHRLRIGQIGLVGFAAQSGEPRIAMDVGGSDLPAAVHFKNPLLPDTRSEAALPLKTAGRVIGVLDIQSTRANAFDEESLEVLRILADQLATAIQNTRLLQEVQQSLSDLQTAYGEVDRQAWQRFAAANEVIGYESDGVNLVPIEQQAVAKPSSTSTEPFSIPLRMRGQTIGSLDVIKEDGELSEGEVFLLASISSRLSQILESARLFEEAQSRAAREQLINRITASIARSLDTDSVLRTAALGLSELPAVMEASVILAPQNAAGNGGRVSGPPAPNGNGSPAEGGEGNFSNGDDHGHHA